MISIEPKIRPKSFFLQYRLKSTSSNDMNKTESPIFNKIARNLHFCNKNFVPIMLAPAFFY